MRYTYVRVITVRCPGREHPYLKRRELDWDQLTVDEQRRVRRHMAAHAELFAAWQPRYPPVAWVERKNETRHLEFIPIPRYVKPAPAPTEI